MCEATCAFKLRQAVNKIFQVVVRFFGKRLRHFADEMELPDESHMKPRRLGYARKGTLVII